MTFNVEALKINLKIKGIAEYFEEESVNSSVNSPNKAANRLERLGSYDGFMKTNTEQDKLGHSRSGKSCTPRVDGQNAGQKDDFFNKQVDTAMSGHEALALVRKLWEEHGKVYSIVFMDCQMPVMDGFECSQKIRDYTEEQRKTSQVTDDQYTTIVAISGFTGEKHEDKCKQHGMNLVLGKPPSDKMMRKVLKDNGFMS